MATQHRTRLAHAPMKRCLERLAWWVTGTKTETERQELSGGADIAYNISIAAANSCPESGDWNEHVMGSVLVIG